MGFSVRRLMIIPYWEDYLDKLEDRKLQKQLEEISTRMDILEKSYFGKGVITRSRQDEKEVCVEDLKKTEKEVQQDA